MLCVASTSLSASASSVGKRNMMSVHIIPSTQKVSHATEKVRLTCAGRFIVFASLIMRESATGRPAVATVRNTL